MKTRDHNRNQKCYIESEAYLEGMKTVRHNIQGERYRESEAYLEGMKTDTR